jgi:hypothetical protein
MEGLRHQLYRGEVSDAMAKETVRFRLLETGWDV